MKRKIETIITITLICISSLVIILNWDNNIIKASVIKILVILVIGIIFLGVLSIPFTKDFFKERKLKSLYLKLKSKTTLSNSEKLYILIYEEHLEDFIRRLKSNQKINSLTYGIINGFNEMFFSLDYRQFTILFTIKEDSIIYAPLPPAKYNQESIAIKELNIKINNFPNLDFFIESIFNLLPELKTIIDNYIETTPVDSIFNGRLLYKLKDLKKKLRLEGCIGIISSLILISLFTIIPILSIKDLYNHDGVIFIYTIVVLIIIFLIVGFIYSLSFILLLFKLNKDIKHQSIDQKVDTPKKVKLAKEFNKYTKTRRIEFIKFYFDDEILIVYVDTYIYVRNSSDSKNIINKLLNTKVNFTFLKQSKIVISGHERILKSLEKQSRKNIDNTEDFF